MENSVLYVVLPNATIYFDTNLFHLDELWPFLVHLNYGSRGGSRRIFDGQVFKRRIFDGHIFHHLIEGNLCSSLKCGSVKLNHMCPLFNNSKMSNIVIKNPE